MDDEKFQKAIDILLKQQAATHAGAEMTKEEQKDHAKRINVVERAIINLYNVSVKQGDSIERQADAISQQAESIAKQSEQIDALVAAQKETNERLNAVIFMAERYFSGQNGKSKK
jgi:uncharacterized coiled-coil protein SlyX